MKITFNLKQHALELKGETESENHQLNYIIDGFRVNDILVKHRIEGGHVVLLLPIK